MGGVDEPGPGQWPGRQVARGRDIRRLRSGDEPRLADAHPVEAPREALEPGGGDEPVVLRRLPALFEHEVPRRTDAFDEEDPPALDAPFPEPVEQGRLERLHDEPVIAHAPSGGVQFGREQFVERQSQRLEMRRVLELGDHADEPALLVGGRVDEREQLAQPDDRVAPVEARARLPDPAESLACAQRREFGPGEVLGEPPGERRPVDLARRASAGELGPCRDIRGARDLVLMTQDEHAVACRDDVGLDRVGAERERQFVGRAGVLGTVAGCPAVADDERRRGGGGRHAPSVASDRERARESHGNSGCCPT